ncbi:sigma factor [Luteitalea sp.]|uniref:sigma factor n=1 Tax=Luteitalea sp. TaxID=2004800 RepID=UPI0025BA4FF9|nr:sigma factor [Luteitalea sp.]
MCREQRLARHLLQGALVHLRALSDPALVISLRARDADALAALYDRHGPCLFALASCILREHPACAAEAEDVVATVFAEAWEYPDRLAIEGTSARTWLTFRVRDGALARRSALSPRPSPTPAPAAPAAIGGPAVRLAYFDGLSVTQIGAQWRTGSAAAARALAEDMRALLSHLAEADDAETGKRDT